MVVLDFGLHNRGDNHHRDRNDESNLIVTSKLRLVVTRAAQGSWLSLGHTELQGAMSLAVMQQLAGGGGLVGQGVGGAVVSLSAGLGGGGGARVVASRGRKGRRRQ